MPLPARKLRDLVRADQRFGENKKSAECTFSPDGELCAPAFLALEFWQCAAA
jgi:hypothetical protein